MTGVESFFTTQSVGTLAGASAAVVAMTLVARKVFTWESAKIPFFLSLIVSFVGAYDAGAWNGPVEVFLIVLNGCLLYCVATGMNETVVSVTERPPAGIIAQHSRSEIKWVSSWLRR